MAIENGFGDAIRPEFRSRSLDHEIAALAASQHGVVTLRQLVARGASRRAIGRRVERRQLRVVHRGIYTARPGRLSDAGRTMAAVLAGGDGAAASHFAAARLRHLPVPARGEVDVTVSRTGLRRPGIRFHHATLALDERDEVDGIATTTVARTLLDLAGVLPPFRIEKLIHEAEYRLLTDVSHYRR